MLVLERIIEQYGAEGEACNLSALVAEAAESVTIPAETDIERFRATEADLQEQFLAFVGTRSVVSSGNHPIVARTRRLVRHVKMY